MFEFPEWATAFPVTEDGKIIMVRQFRQALGVTCIELPGGCIDDTDASPEAGVRRELLEETGYVFNEVHCLGEISSNPSTNFFTAGCNKHVHQVIVGRRVRRNIAKIFYFIKNVACFFE